MNKPNFLIVGAPKCGTTSLYSYLNQHPDIFLPSIKEPHYFGKDLTSVGFTGKKNKYLKLFESAQVPLRGEASTWYLYSKTAAKEIYNFDPNIKIIAMLRNPVFAAQSLHNQTLYGLNEDIENFGKAVKMESVRKKGEQIPPNNKRLEALYYLDAYRYGTQLKRYFEVFKKDQVKVILFDDFVKNTEDVTNEILKFLDAQYPFQFKIEARNGRKAPKSKYVQKILSKKNKKVSKLIPVRFRRTLHDYFKQWNSKSKEKDNIPTDIKMYIFDKLEQEINLAEKLIKRDLNDWKFG